MKPIIIDFSDSSSESLYIQLYEKIRDGILSGEIKEGEKLPSLRSLSKALDVSITTTQTAYNQLLVEGYIISRPQSGYYAAQGLSTGQIPYSPGRQAPLTEQVFKSKRIHIYVIRNVLTSSNGRSAPPKSITNTPISFSLRAIRKAKRPSAMR